MIATHYVFRLVKMASAPKISYNYYLKCDLKSGGPIITAVGLLVSLWVNCIFAINIKRKITGEDKYFGAEAPHFYENDLILRTVQYEYLIIVLLSNAALLWGFKKKNTKYFLPWCCLKVTENIILLADIVLPFIYSTERLTGLLAIGLLILAVNSYTIMCVIRAFTMPLNIPSDVENNVDTMPFIKETSKDEKIDTTSLKETSSNNETEPANVVPQVHKIHKFTS